MFGNNGNAQTKQTSDAGGTAATLSVSRVRAFQRVEPEANRMTASKPTTDLSHMKSNDKLSGSRSESDLNVGLGITLKER